MSSFQIQMFTKSFHEQIIIGSPCKFFTSADGLSLESELQQDY